MFKLFGRPSKKTGRSQSSNDREDEGFVLVGETPSERNSNKNSIYHQGPPSYFEQVNRSMGANQSAKDDTGGAPATETRGAEERNPAEFFTLTQEHFSKAPNTAAPVQGSGSAPPPAVNNTGTFVPQPGAPQNSAAAQEPLSPKTVYEDIPFKLNPILESRFGDNGMHSSLIPMQRPNLASYYYDFSLERSTLKDSV